MMYVETGRSGFLYGFGLFGNLFHERRLVIYLINPSSLSFIFLRRKEVSLTFSVELGNFLVGYWNDATSLSQSGDGFTTRPDSHSVLLLSEKFFSQRLRENLRRQFFPPVTDENTDVVLILGCQTSPDFERERFFL